MRPFVRAHAVLVLLAGALSACSNDEEAAVAAAQEAAAVASLDTLPADARVIETLAYNDANDIWRVWFAPAADGTRAPVLRQRALKIARIGDAQVKKGIKAHIRDVAGEPVAYLPSTFRVDLFHGVTEQRLVPGTSETREVVVRYNRQPWQPLLVSLAATGGTDTLSRPALYYPPLFTGRPLVGFAATGATLDEARMAYKKATGAWPTPYTMDRQGFLEDLPDAGPPTDAGPGRRVARDAAPLGNRMVVPTAPASAGPADAGPAKGPPRKKKGAKGKRQR